MDFKTPYLEIRVRHPYVLDRSKKLNYWNFEWLTSSQFTQLYRGRDSNLKHSIYLYYEVNFYPLYYLTKKKINHTIVPCSLCALELCKVCNCNISCIPQKEFFFDYHQFQLLICRCTPLNTTHFEIAEWWIVWCIEIRDQGTVLTCMRLWSLWSSIFSYRELRDEFIFVFITNFYNILCPLLKNLNIFGNIFGKVLVGK